LGQGELLGERPEEAVGLTKNVIRRLVCDHLPGKLPGQNKAGVGPVGPDRLYFPVN
jgi:hypothetical protein